MVNDVAVLAEQRGHVRDSADGRELHKPGAPLLAELRAQYRLRQFQRHAHAGQMVEPIRGVRRPRIDDCDGTGQGSGRKVMVGDDDIHTERTRVGGLVRVRHATVHGDDEARALLMQLGDGVAVETVTLAHAVGNVVLRPQPVPVQRLDEQRGARNAVRVEIAEDGDGLPIAPRSQEPLCRVLDVRQRVRVLEEAVGDVEEITRLVRVADAAPLEQVGDDGGQGCEG